MTTYNKAMQILSGRKMFTFDGTILTVSDYYTGDSVKIDFANMDEDTFKTLQLAEDAVIQYDEDEDEWQVWDEMGNDLWATFSSKIDAIEWCEEQGFYWEEQWS